MKQTHRTSAAPRLTELLEPRRLLSTTLYAVNDQDLATLNTATGQLTNIAPFATPSGEYATTIATSPSGALYAIVSGGVLSTTPAQLYLVNPATAGLTAIGAPQTNGFNGMAFSPSGVLYAMESPFAAPTRQLYTIDTTTGVNTLIGTLSDGSSNFYPAGLAIDSQGNLYTSDLETGDLDLVDPATAAVTPIGGTGDPDDIYNLAIGSDGTLYGTTNSATLVSINLDTAMETTLAETPDAYDGVPIAAGPTGSPGGGGGGTTTTSGSLSVAVSHSTLPTSIIAGAPARGTVDVTLTDTASTSITDSSVGLYLSADGAVDSSAISIGQISRATVVKSGKSVSVAIAVKSLPTTLDGTYTLLAQATESTGTTDVSAAGPTLKAAAPFIAFSETVVKSTLAPTDITGQTTRESVELKITNNGNIVSAGHSTIDLYFSPDATPTDGTLLRDYPENLALKPGASRPVPLQLPTLPSLANGTYDLVAQVTDPKANQTSVVVGTYTLEAPVVSLVPSAGTYTPAANGTGKVDFTVTNAGNVMPKGPSTISLYASANGSLAGATLVVKQKATLALAPGHSTVLQLGLKKSTAALVLPGDSLIQVVTDPLGNTQTTLLSVV